MKRKLSIALLAAFCMSLLASSAFAATSFYVTTPKTDVTAEGTQARFNTAMETGGSFDFYAPRISVTTQGETSTSARYMLSVIGAAIGDAWFQYWDRFGQGYEAHEQYTNTTTHMGEFQVPIQRCWNQITFNNANGTPIGTNRMSVWFGPSGKSSNMSGCVALAGGTNDFHFPVIYMGSTAYSVYARDPDGRYTEFPVNTYFFNLYSHWTYTYSTTFSTTRSTPTTNADAPQLAVEAKNLKVVKSNNLGSFLKKSEKTPGNSPKIEDSGAKQDSNAKKTVESKERREKHPAAKRERPERRRK